MTHCLHLNLQLRLAKNRMPPIWSSMVDDANVRDGIGVVRSPFFICGLAFLFTPRQPAHAVTLC